MTMTLDGTNGVTFFDTSLQGAAASPYGLKNRIINGAMVIDQRNAGASVATTTVGGFVYTLDRWNYYGDASSKFTVQQNAAAVTPPTTFSNYLGITSTSAYTVAAGQVFSIAQFVEGFNTADLDFGKATAKTVTLSFWVRSSLTGTFGGSILNSAANRSYPFSYTISTANTWEQKTITIAGDTTGTWLTTNGIGIKVFWGLGVGSTYSGTASSWAATQYYSATGATSVVGTNGATWYVTGVQLEIGSTATPFEQRLYNQELANCQRYYESSYTTTTAPAAGVSSTLTSWGNWTAYATTAMRSNHYSFNVSKRAAPTMTYFRTSESASNNNSWQWYNGAAWTNSATATTTLASTNQGFAADITAVAVVSNSSYIGSGGWVASSEL